MYIKHLIPTEKWMRKKKEKEKERESETVTNIVIDFEYMYVFIDVEKSLYRFWMELFRRVMPVEMIYKWAIPHTIDRQRVEVRFK